VGGHPGAHGFHARFGGWGPDAVDGVGPSEAAEQHKATEGDFGEVFHRAVCEAGQAFGDSGLGGGGVDLAQPLTGGVVVGGLVLGLAKGGGEGAFVEVGEDLKVALEGEVLRLPMSKVNLLSIRPVRAK